LMGCSVNDLENSRHGTVQAKFVWESKSHLARKYT
jgi:hypothetical protein